MSRINTNILQVPGVPSGQMDERAAGAYTAPLQAAGEALADLGDLGQEIAVREQRLRDQKESAQILNEMELLNQETMALAQEADSPEAIQELTEGLNAKYNELGERAGGIKGRQAQDALNQQMSLSGGRTQLSLDRRRRTIEVDDARLQYSLLAENIARDGLMSGDTDFARQKIRALFNTAEGTSYSKSEIEEQYRKHVRAMDYFDASSRLANDENFDLDTYKGLDIAQYGELSSRQQAMKRREDQQQEAATIRAVPRLASDAAVGIFNGERVGSPDEAMKRLRAEIRATGLEGVELDNQLRIAEEQFTYARGQSEITKFFDGDNADALDRTAEWYRGEADRLRGTRGAYLVEAYSRIAEDAESRASAVRTGSNREQIAGADADLLRLNNVAHISMGMNEDSVTLETKLIEAMGGDSEFAVGRYEHGDEMFHRINDQIKKMVSDRQELFRNQISVSNLRGIMSSSSGNKREAAVVQVGDMAAGADASGNYDYDLFQETLSADTELGNALRESLVFANDGAPYSPATMGYVAQLNSLDGEDYREVLSVVGSLASDRLIRFDVNRIPDSILKPESKLVVNQYVSNLKATSDKSEAMRLALEAGRPQAVADFYKSFASSLGSERRGSLSETLLGFHERVGTEGVAEEGREALESILASQLAGGGEPTASHIEKANRLFGQVENAFFYHSVEEGVGSVGTGAVTDVQISSAWQKAVSSVVGARGQTIFSTKKDGRGIHREPASSMEDWSVESVYGISVGGDRSNQSLDAINLALLRELGKKMGDSDFVEQLEVQGVNTSELKYAVENAWVFRGQNEKQNEYIRRYGAELLKDPSSAVKLFSDSDAARSIYANHPDSSSLGGRALDMKGLSSEGVRNRVTSILAKNLVASPGQILPADVQARWDNLSHSGRMFNSRNSSTPVYEIPARTAATYSFITDDQRQLFSFDATPRPEDVLVSRAFNAEIHESVGKTIPELMGERMERGSRTILQGGSYLYQVFSGQ